jgi:NRPS condensation-like uncharacterized protein
VPAQDPLGVRDVRALAGAATLDERLGRARALRRRAAKRCGPPTRLARDGASGRSGYGFVLEDLSAEETNAVFDRRGEGTTVNDALLAALAVAIRRWNDEHGRRPGRIALSMPVNLRPPAWRTEVVGNFASYATVSLGAWDSVDPARALTAVAEETRAIKHDGLAGSVVDMLAGTGKLTIAVKRRLPDLIAMTGNVVVDTASLSNLGVLGGLPVQAAWFSPPGRMPLGAAFGAVTLDGRLHVTLRYRHALLDAAGARMLVSRYREALTT